MNSFSEAPSPRGLKTRLKYFLGICFIMSAAKISPEETNIILSILGDKPIHITYFMPGCWGHAAPEILWSPPLHYGKLCTYPKIPIAQALTV